MTVSMATLTNGKAGLIPGQTCHGDDNRCLQGNVLGDLSSQLFNTALVVHRIYISSAEAISICYSLRTHVTW